MNIHVINVIFRPYARVSKCNMSLESSHPKFQTNLGYIQLLKVNIIVDITQRHSITEDRYVSKKIKTNKKIPNDHFRLQPWFLTFLANYLF